MSDYHYKKKVGKPEEEHKQQPEKKLPPTAETAKIMSYKEHQRSTKNYVDTNDLGFINYLYKISLEEECWYRDKWLERKTDLAKLYRICDKYKAVAEYREQINSLVRKIDSDTKTHIRIESRIKEVREKQDLLKELVHEYDNVDDERFAEGMIEIDYDRRLAEIKADLNFIDSSDIEGVYNRIIENKLKLREILQSDLYKISEYLSLL